MKSIFALAVAASVASTAAAAKCGLTQLLPIVVPLLGDDNYKQCQTDGGYTFYPFAGLPTPEQEAKLCASKACQAVLKQVAAEELPDCDLELDDGTKLNLQATIDKYATQCLPRNALRW